MGCTRERDRRQTLVAAAASNQRAVDLATALYTRGLSDFLSVLDAQRNAFQTQSDLAESETAVSTDLVALHKALGRLGCGPHAGSDGAANDGLRCGGCPRERTKQGVKR